MARRKTRRTPPRNAKGRFVKRSHARATTHRRRRHVTHRRRHVTLHRGQVAIVNPRRRRHSRRSYASHRRVRRYRRNAPMFAGIGLNMETFKTVGLTAGGFLGTPFVEGFLVNYLPTSITGNKFARYAIRIGAAVGLGFLIGKAMGRDAGKKVAVGGLAYVGVGIIRDFMPQIGGGTGAYLRSQPLLGTYQRSSMGSYMTSTAPARLNPANRY